MEDVVADDMPAVEFLNLGVHIPFGGDLEPARSVPKPDATS